MKFEKDAPYVIFFKDHCLSQEHELMDCVVMGWVLSQDKYRVTITYWQVADVNSRAENSEPVNIVKNAITKAKKLKI